MIQVLLQGLTAFVTPPTGVNVRVQKGALPARPKQRKLR